MLKHEANASSDQYVEYSSDMMSNTDIASLSNTEKYNTVPIEPNDNKDKPSYNQLCMELYNEKQKSIQTERTLINLSIKINEQASLLREAYENKVSEIENTYQERIAKYKKQIYNKNIKIAYLNDQIKENEYTKSASILNLETPYTSITKSVLSQQDDNTLGQCLSDDKRMSFQVPASKCPSNFQSKVKRLHQFGVIKPQHRATCSKSEYKKMTEIVDVAAMRKKIDLLESENLELSEELSILKVEKQQIEMKYSDLCQAKQEPADNAEQQSKIAELEKKLLESQDKLKIMQRIVLEEQKLASHKKNASLVQSSLQWEPMTERKHTDHITAHPYETYVINIE